MGEKLFGVSNLFLKYNIWLQSKNFLHLVILKQLFRKSVISKALF